MEGCSTKFSTGHTESIHDICYDFYGRRLATCSADRCIKVWDLNKDGEWILSGGMSGNISEGHTGVVVRVAWAHPEFGSVLASCSEDHSVIVWKEELMENAERHWDRKANLTDARQGVQDIKFAPHHYGLELAAGSKDGFIRIYKAEDSMKPNPHWSLVHEFEAAKSFLRTEVRCLSWNPSRFDTRMMVVGCTAPKNPDPQNPESTVMVWTFNESYRKWLPLPVLIDCPRSDVWSVSWAPNMGRRQHYIACCSRDANEHLRLWEIPAGEDIFSHGPDGGARHSVAPHVLEPSSSQTRRVEWNVSGTVLATSGDGGEVLLWSRDHFSKEWTNTIAK